VNTRTDCCSIEAAVESAVDECIKEGILADFLIGHKAEVMDVCLTEYDEAATMNAFKEEEAERVWSLYEYLQDNNRLDDWNRSIHDKNLRKKLLSELPDDYS
jgi:superfamily II RNA helicase